MDTLTVLQGTAAALGAIWNCILVYEKWGSWGKVALSVCGAAAAAYVAYLKFGSLL